jgi:peptidoglycan-associated lipoprotein
MKTRSLSNALLVSGALACGCSHAAPPAQAPVAMKTAAPPPAPPSAPVPEKPLEQPSQPSLVALSDEIRELCGITSEDAYFKFDSAALSGQAGSVLGKVAECVEHGKLTGRSLTLVGRADPRGTSEYNLLLGGRRAFSVQKELEHQGMRANQLTVTSRGDLAATGTDEAGWAVDRRVDVLVTGSKRAENCETAAPSKLASNCL